MRAGDIRKLFEERYKDDKLVKIVAGVPEIKDIAGKNGVLIGGFQVHSSGRRVVAVVRSFLFRRLAKADADLDWVQGALDNLLKGAATQCLQVSRVGSLEREEGLS